ncbi:hypothetical protein ACSBR2_031562 [Camellia fascicularis]
MEVSGVVFRPIPCYSGAGIDAHSHSSSKPSVSSGMMGMPVHGGAPFSCRLLGSRVSRIRKFSNYGFCDGRHMQYYYGYGSTPPIRAGTGKKDHVKEKETTANKKNKLKKRLKLLKGLSKDLSMFSDMGFGLDPHNHGLVDQVKGKMISEATELLLAQLQQLKAEEEELKKRRKEDKAKLKAASMLNRLDCELSSGSSSESSSDSECGEVVDMSCLKSKTLAPSVVNELQPVMQEATLNFPSTPTQEPNATELQSVIREAMLAVPTTMNQEGKMIEERGIESNSHNLEQQCCTETSNSCNVGVGGSSYDDGRSVAVAAALESTKKVEVCMGGKCKKSGAPALLEEFQRVLGAEGAVVGCKCMGKCREGPNIRVLNYTGGVEAEGVDDSVRIPANPLCIGVGFEDVGLIVANFFGETQKELGLAAAS